MRARDRVITVQGILSIAAVTAMLGYASHTLELWPTRSVAAQNVPQQSSSAPSMEQAQQQAPEQASGTSVFTGVVVRDGSEFVLRASSSGAVFRLDSPSKARLFEGKPVRVTGKLKETAKLIQVEAIEEAGA